MKLVSSLDDPTINIYATLPHQSTIIDIDIIVFSKNCCIIHVYITYQFGVHQFWWCRIRLCQIEELRTLWNCNLRKWLIFWKIYKFPIWKMEETNNFCRWWKSENIKLQWVGFENKELGFSFGAELEINSFNQRIQLHFQLAISMEKFFWNICSALIILRPAFAQGLKSGGRGGAKFRQWGNVKEIQTTGKEN